MFPNEKGDYELNIVYTPEAVDEFRSVNVVLKVMKKKINLSIYSQDEIEPVDLKKILNDLHKKIDSKTGIDIQHDCSVYLFINEKEFYIEQYGSLKIYSLIYNE